MSIINAVATAGSSSGATAGVNKNELGQEDFLKLLVAQMKNQDPNNPADNGEFLSQIAQFSMVSGIDDLGTSFNGVAGHLYANQAMQAASLVGREVLAESSSGIFTGENEVEGVIYLPEGTDALNIQVRDASGALVKTLDPGNYKSGEVNFSWNGENEAGEVQDEGEYYLSATALVGGYQQSISLGVYQQVESVTVDRESNAVSLHLENRDSIPFSQVTQYR